MPAFAIISGIGIISIKYVKLQKIIILLTIILGCVQYFAISYHIGFLPGRIGAPALNKISLFNREIETNYRNDLDIYAYPSSVDWRNQEILNEIITSSGNSRHTISTFFISAIPQVYEPIAYLSFIKKYPIIINIVSLAEEELYKDVASTTYMITASDYVIMRKNEKFNIEFPLFVRTRIKEARQLFERNINMFKLIRKFKLEDGSTLLMFKKKEDYMKITDGPLEFYFRSGVAKIYFNGVEITRDLGLETLFNFGGKQYSSAQAIWDMKNIEDKKIIAIARWAEIPFCQRWEFSIRNSRSIGWKVAMEVPEKTVIKDRISALVLSEKYKEWLSPQGIKNFSGKNISVFKETILPESIHKYVGVCSVKKAHLPKVVFQLDADQYKITPIIKWRKNLRIIEFIKTEMESVSYSIHEKGSFFSGCIVIGEDKL